MTEGASHNCASFVECFRVMCGVKCMLKCGVECVLKCGVKSVEQGPVWVGVGWMRCL